MVKKKIIIVEDHTILRAGLTALLSSNPEFEIVAEADNGKDAILRAGEYRPDLIIMDLNMPGLSGMDAISEIKNRYPEIKILVLTVHKEEEYVLTCLERGASGYVLKDATHTELMAGAQMVLDGKTYLSPEVTQKVVNSVVNSKGGSQPTTAWETVTQRERQILKLVAEGHTNKSMAEYLCISVKTVEKHRSSLMKKLDLHNASMLTSYAMEKGLI
ncbi:MAG: response regulator transcription factor [Candidatus Sedimenticola sp. PURPLELP]